MPRRAADLGGVAVGDDQLAAVSLGRLLQVVEIAHGDEPRWHRGENRRCDGSNRRADDRTHAGEEGGQSQQKVGLGRDGDAPPGEGEVAVEHGVDQA